MSAPRFAKPPVLAELSGERHGIIEASAGTGKTYSLEHLVVELLLSAGAELPQVLVVTFTERAAAELRQRLRAKLRALLELARGPAPAGAQELPAWPLDQEAAGRLTQALATFDQATVSTIHGFCQRVLGEQSFATGRLFAQRLVDGRTAFERALVGVLREDSARHPELAEYLGEWLEAGELGTLAQLLWACRERGGRLWPEFSAPELSRAAATLGQLCPAPRELEMILRRTELRAQTVRAICDRWERLALHLGAFSRGELSAAALHGRLHEEERRFKGFLRFLDERLQPVRLARPELHQLQAALATLAKSTVSLEAALAQLLLPRVLARAAAEKAAQGEIDFDDMLGLLAGALASPEGAALSARLRARWRFAVVDEFQDTDPVQWDIFSRLFLAPPSRLYLIGDPKQAIYSFRGADVFTYLRATRALAEVGAPTARLGENHRSRPPLVQALNLIFADEGGYFRGAIRYPHPVRPARAELDAAQEGPPVHVVALEPPPGQEDKPSAALLRRTLAGYIAREAQALVAGGRSAREIFVLTRSIKESQEIARALSAAGLPTAFYKEEGLFQSPEARALHEVLAGVAEPERRGRRLRALGTPFFAVPLAELPEHLELEPSHPAAALLLHWNRLGREKAYAELFNSLLADSGLVLRQLFSAESERALTNYQHILELLLEEAGRTRPTMLELVHALAAFIEGRRLPESAGGNLQRLESDRAAIQVMSMHKAKGLEAPVVFVYGGLEASTAEVVHTYHAGEERRLSLRKEEGDPGRIEAEREEEDRRLLYVALTRARDRLYLPYLAPEHGLSRLSGAYRGVNEALGRLPLTQLPALFRVERLPLRPRGAETEEPPLLSPLATWTPGPPAPIDPGLEGRTAALRAAGTLAVTSYSRIKAEKGGYTPPAPVGGARDELEPEVDLVREERGADLPGGPASGRFLHELLELLPLEVLRDAPSFDFWAARQDTRRLFQEALLRHDRPLSALSRSQQIVFAALTSPLPLGRGRLAGGLVRAEQVVRELEFLYPHPAGAAWPLDQRPDGWPARAEAGFIKGFIDVVFEVEGRIYVLDWKSDLLPSYAEDSLLAHVRQNYELQASLYLLAVLRLLGVHDRPAYEARFGGVLFAFVRGMTPAAPDPRGLYFTRPTFTEVLALERRLARRDRG